MRLHQIRLIAAQVLAPTVLMFLALQAKLTSRQGIQAGRELLFRLLLQKLNLTQIHLLATTHLLQNQKNQLLPQIQPLLLRQIIPKAHLLKIINPEKTPRTNPKLLYTPIAIHPPRTMLSPNRQLLKLNQMTLIKIKRKNLKLQRTCQK